MARSRIRESWGWVMGSRANSLLEPRREITFSIVSFGTFESSGSCRRRALTFGSGIFCSGVLPRQAATSSRRIQRRGFMHSAHRRIIHLFRGVRYGRQIQRRNFRGSGRSRFLISDGNYRKRHFAVSLEAEQRVYLRVDESGDDRARETSAKLQLRAGWRRSCHCPIRNDDKCGSGISRRCASKYRSKR